MSYKQPRFFHLTGAYYFCLSSYSGMGFGMGKDYTYFERVFPCIYKLRGYEETIVYFDALRERFGK